MHHFKVVTAETADDAIDMIHLHRPVAAIIDLRLARGSGRDVVVSMPAGTPVIIFSGVPSESAELERLRPRTRLVPEALLADHARRSTERNDQQREAAAGYRCEGLQALGGRSQSVTSKNNRRSDPSCSTTS